MSFGHCLLNASSSLLLRLGLGDLPFTSRALALQFEATFVAGFAHLSRGQAQRWPRTASGVW
eukprot:3853922-Alexandrium_andersonii.AAC.1